MGKAKVVDDTINRIYGTVISGFLCTSIIVSGGNVYYSNMNINRPFVSTIDNQTNIISTGGRVDITTTEIINSKDCDRDSFTTVIDAEKMNNLKRLDNISKLEENWNQEGAKPFNSTLISKVRVLITMLDIQPEIFPIASDGIQFEYDGPSGSYLELEIREEKTAQVYVIDKNGNESYQMISTDAGSINGLVKAFYG